MAIPYVSAGNTTDAAAQNALIDQVNTNEAFVTATTATPAEINQVCASINAAVTAASLYFTVSRFAELKLVDGTAVNHANATTEDTVDTSTYTKVKEVVCGFRGTFTVTFSLKVVGGAVSVYGRIYKNGVAFGTEQSTTSSSYVDKVESLTFETGDLIQLYIKGVAGSYIPYTNKLLVQSSGDLTFDGTFTVNDA